jgi:signal transduction histidine kinase
MQVCGIPLIPVWWGVNVRQHRDAAEAERARADQLARIADLDRDAAVREERARMARDLHDVIAGHLSAIAIQSAAALSMASCACPLRRKASPTSRDSCSRRSFDIRNIRR